MAVQGSGLGKGPDNGFKDQTSFNARNGAAKRTQDSFPVHPGMADQTRAMSGVAGGGTGPDASSGNPLDPQSAAQRGKAKPAPLKASWDMKDANGKGVDNDIGGKVVGEAILSGGAKLPEGESYSNAGPSRKPA